ncbi:MAG: hypothetical protein QGF46_03365, partial [Planctomycetota bacterium]|nr:hypothetical protein [Planctomycetota bacterium]
MKQTKIALALVFAVAVTGCGPAEIDSSTQTGSFEVLSVNILDGEQWSINRPIQIQFNHDIDFSSVSFQSVTFRAINIVGAAPVTGQFEISPDDPTILNFNPACPTN